MSSFNQDSILDFVKMQFVHSVVRVDNLLWPRIAREESPKEGLSALALPVAMSVGIILKKFIDVGRPSPLQAEPFQAGHPEQYERGNGLRTSKQGSQHASIGFPVFDHGYTALTSSYGGLLPRIISWNEPPFLLSCFCQGVFIKATEMKLEQVPIVQSYELGLILSCGTKAI